MSQCTALGRKGGRAVASRGNGKEGRGSFGGTRQTSLAINLQSDDRNIKLSDRNHPPPPPPRARPRPPGRGPTEGS